MTTPDPSESGQVIGAQNANSDTSQTGGQQTSQGNADAMPEWAAEISKRLDRIERNGQSNKDRGISNINKQLAEFRPILERVKKIANMDDVQMAELQESLELDEMKRRVLGNENTQTGNLALEGNQNEDAAAEAAKAVVSEFGLKLDDPIASKAIAETGGDPLKLAIAIGKAIKAQPVKPEANPAAIAQTTGGSSAGVNVDDLLAEHEKLSKKPSENRERLKEVKKQLDAAGWGLS